MQEEKIVATLVTDEDERIEFLPRLLGMRNLMRGQNKPFEWAGRLSKDYGGGSWAFYDLSSNGGALIGGYLAPQGSKQFTVIQNMNGYEGVMSADALGLTATIFTIAELMQNGDEKLITLYYHLLDFAAQHNEASEIFGAID